MQAHGAGWSFFVIASMVLFSFCSAYSSTTSVNPKESLKEFRETENFKKYAAEVRKLSKKKPGGGGRIQFGSWPGPGTPTHPVSFASESLRNRSRLYTVPSSAAVRANTKPKCQSAWAPWQSSEGTYRGTGQQLDSAACDTSAASSIRGLDHSALIRF